MIRLTRARIATGAVAAAALLAAALAVILAAPGQHARTRRPATRESAASRPGDIPARAAAYLGVFAAPSPRSYAGVRAFSARTGVRPDMVVYYSAWREPFRAGFARSAARHHAVPLVQIDPAGIRLAAIASGRYDGYLRSYARSVRDFGGRVIVSFGHEMNGHWYSWAHRHASPRAFVAAWRHIVTVFRAAGARDVTWLWTVNIIDRRLDIPSPAAWWPGRSYVTWVGIDGYYLKPSWDFAPLFGPTIKAVRAFSLDPILISETAATPSAGKSAKIADLFAGVRAYGLLGFVWFDVNKTHNWRLAGPGAIAAYRRGAATFTRPAP
jgi:hypothetical protein